MDGEVPGHKDEFCKGVVPFRSKGVWGRIDLKTLLQFDLPRLQFQLAAIYILTQSLHGLFRRLRFPRIVAEIMAGVILGPSILGHLSQKIEITFFPPEGEVFLETLSRLGFIFFMFLIGVKMEPSLAMRSGRRAWVIAVVSVVVPLVIATWGSEYLDSITAIAKRPSIRTVVSVQTLAPFPVIALLLMDLEIMNTELGRLALASALISDLGATTLSTCLSVARLGFISSNTERISFSIVTQSICFTALIIFTIVFLIRPFFLIWIIKRTPEGKPVEGFYVTIIVGIVLFLAIISDGLGLPYQFGPFVLGLSVPVGPPLGATLVERLETITSGLFAPLMATFCGLRIDFTEFFDLQFQGLIFKICFGSACIKLLITFGVAFATKVPPKDAACLSFILNAQGIVEMAAYLNSTLNESLDRETLASTTLSVLIISTIATLVERSLYDFSKIYTGYQKRDIQHSPYNAELRIIACCHRHDEALAAIRLLEASNPTKESPIAAYALNLVEIRGRASPLLINHGLGQKGSLGSSHSKQMIDTFSYLESQNRGLVNVQVFTAISLPKFMHYDICSLALDNLTSLIILPFHRKWNYQGHMIYDSSVVRAINRQVLELAPCSVGVLVDRRKLHHTSPVDSIFYRVAVVFLGGDDDREALAYGRRMSNSPGVHLTVVRLTGLEKDGKDQWDFMLDSESLREIKLHLAHQGNIELIEETLGDASDIAAVLREMEDDFDLIMVGRRHKDLQALSSLEEWSEVRELGILGDMLSSADINKPVSVLVVQQQLVQLKGR